MMSSAFVTKNFSELADLLRAGQAREVADRVLVADHQQDRVARAAVEVKRIS
jgi:hypothetical protein